MPFQSPLTAEKHGPSFSPMRAVALIGALVFGVSLREFLIRAGLLAGQSELLTTLELCLIVLIAGASPLVVREVNRRKSSAIEAQQAWTRLELLFKMTDMLQSALGPADANEVLRSTACSLMPGFGGALYIFNNSGDRLALSTSWNWPDSGPCEATIAPDDCWAVKRGKVHLNLVGDTALCCHHHQKGLVTLEIPMMARGEIYGLLLVERSGASAADDLRSVLGVATALADAMSLSLSNLALRERLRTQALRDTLTGLYNRRYMEDALQRAADQASRSQSPLSILMIDLDHFKKLNDEHGHAMGDAVLTETAAAILGVIRPCDVACRYGGEELVVLLPDCPLEEACAKADVIRSRIERLSEVHGMPVSASFGVATIPETSNERDALADADRALYRAKEQGRNRVVPASRQLRGIREATTNKAA